MVGRQIKENIIFTALFSFLGGSVFRMLFGEISSYLNKKQDHAQEVAMMELQSKMDDRAHDRTQTTIRLQAELGVKTIEVQRDAAVATEDARAFAEALKVSMTPTGIRWVDSWNAVVRPSFATVGLSLWVFKLSSQGFVMDDFDMTLFGTITGFFFGSRYMQKMGK